MLGLRSCVAVGRAKGEIIYIQNQHETITLPFSVKQGLISKMSSHVAQDFLLV